VIRLSIIIVSWNVRDLLLDCIRSVRAQMLLPALEWELIVVDNASQDGTADAVRALSTEIRVIANRENAGFGAANNQAYKIARGRSILLLNPDTVIVDHAIDRLLEKLEEHPRAGAIGCRLLNADLSFQRWTGGSLPTLANGFCHFLFLNKLLPAWMLPAPIYLESDPKRDRRTGWVSGACMLLRRDALDSAAHPEGIFDSRYFLYGEDLDLCRRIARASWEVVYTPAVAVIHLEGRSFAQSSLEIQNLKPHGLRAVFVADRSRLAVFLFDLIAAAGFTLRYLVNRIADLVMPGRGYSARAQGSRQRLAETVRAAARHHRATP
jgi:N-acetylglucosaminyl-diphospho-decaprenol L-rhamnosyltransferase